MPFDGDIRAFERVIAPVVETNAQRMIRRTRERIATPQKWVKGALYSRGRMCLLGALEPEMWIATALVERAIRKEERAFSSIPHFNDDPRTRHVDVLRVLDKAYALGAKGRPTPKRQAPATWAGSELTAADLIEFARREMQSRERAPEICTAA